MTVIALTWTEYSAIRDRQNGPGEPVWTDISTRITKSDTGELVGIHRYHAVDGSVSLHCLYGVNEVDSETTINYADWTPCVDGSPVSCAYAARDLL